MSSVLGVGQILEMKDAGEGEWAALPSAEQFSTAIDVSGRNRGCEPLSRYLPRAHVLIANSKLLFVYSGSGNGVYDCDVSHHGSSVT